MKKLLPITILIIFALSITNPVYACPGPLYSARIKCDIEESLLQQRTTCLNDDCSVNVSKIHSLFGDLSLNLKNLSLEVNEHYGFIILGFYRWNIPINQQLLSYLDPICVENLNDIKPILAQEVQNWKSTNKEDFLGGNLIFEPYSSGRESELIKSRNAYGICHFEDFKRVGNWLVVTKTSRDYCYLTGGVPLMCPDATISHAKFLGFLLRNPNGNTFMYLAGYLIPLGIFIGFLVYLFKRKELKSFFKPNKFSIIFTFVMGVPAFFWFILISGKEQIIIWISGSYTFASLVKYLYTRIKEK